MALFPKDVLFAYALSKQSPYLLEVYSLYYSFLVDQLQYGRLMAYLDLIPPKEEPQHICQLSTSGGHHVDTTGNAKTLRKRLPNV